MDEQDVEIYIKHRGSGPNGLTGTVHIVPGHPFDMVGWVGRLHPYVVNIADCMPITGKVHQPPPVHQVFEGRNFLICNFVPRKVDYHPSAVAVRYHHSNVDSDEIMFYGDACWPGSGNPRCETGGTVCPDEPSMADGLHLLRHLQRRRLADSPAESGVFPRRPRYDTDLAE